MSFEDLIAWQKARALTGEVYRVTRVEPFSRDFGLRDQLQRAAVSVMANIAEGWERHRDSEFLHYLSIATGSCAEVVSHPHVALDAGYLNKIEFESLRAQALEVGRIIAGLRARIAADREGIPNDGR